MRTLILNLSPVGQTGLAIAGLLVLATAGVAWLCHARPHRDFTELISRVRSWWIMSGFFFGSLVLGDRVSLLFFALISIWCLREFATLLPSRPADHGALVLAFLAVPLQYYWIGTGQEELAQLFIPFGMAILIPFSLVLSQETAGLLASASQVYWGLMVFAFGLSHLAFLLRLPKSPDGSADGRSLLLFLVVLVQASDILQYLWGKCLGRHKILPRVSPNKTWEGFLGGIATATAASLALGFLTPFSLPECLAVALATTLLGFVGGAVMSALKRDLGVKDFGRMIPGHGGILDRMDSLCYACPVFFYYVRHAYY